MVDTLICTALDVSCGYLMGPLDKRSSSGGRIRDHQGFVSTITSIEARYKISRDNQGLQGERKTGKHTINFSAILIGGIICASLVRVSRYI